MNLINILSMLHRTKYISWSHLVYFDFVLLMTVIINCSLHISIDGESRSENFGVFCKRSKKSITSCPRLYIEIFRCIKNFLFYKQFFIKFFYQKLCKCDFKYLPFLKISIYISIFTNLYVLLYFNVQKKFFLL